MLVFPSRPPYRRHEPYQLLTPHAAEHHKRQCDVVSYARLLRLRRLKCTAGFSLGEQHGDRTRPSAPTVRSCLIELLIRSRPSSVGSVSQIGGQYPLCAFSADIILTYNDRTERTTFNYCTLYTCLQSFWHCREISPLLVLLFVPSFCILRNAE